MAEGYRLADEPAPGGLAILVVNPIWPLFAVMLGGMWLGLPWAVFNGFAMGSPNRFWELGLAVAGFVVNALLVFALLFLIGTETLPAGAVPYLFIGITVWRLGVAYLLYEWQNQSFDLYEYFGGTVQNGLPVLVLGFFARGVLAKWPLLILLVG